MQIAANIVSFALSSHYNGLKVARFVPEVPSCIFLSLGSPL